MTEAEAFVASIRTRVGQIKEAQRTPNIGSWAHHARWKLHPEEEIAVMPLYDCGDKECDECQRAFGPNREKAIKNFEAREAAYASLELANSLEGGHMIVANLDQNNEWKSVDPMLVVAALRFCALTSHHGGAVDK